MRIINTIIWFGCVALVGLISEFIFVETTNMILGGVVVIGTILYFIVRLTIIEAILDKIFPSRRRNVEEDEE